MAEEILKPQKFNCPKCGAPQELDARFCSKCGSYIIPGGRNSTQQKEEEKQKITKRKKIILILLGVGVLISIILVYVWWAGGKKERVKAENFKVAVEGVWSELLKKTDEISSQIVKTTKVEDFEILTPLFDDFINFLDQKEFEVTHLEVPKNYSEPYQKLKDTTKKLREYSEDFREKIKNPSRPSSEDLLVLKNKAESAKGASEEFTSQAKFVEGNIKNEFFKTNPISEIIKQFQASEQAKLEEAKRKAAKQASETLVLNFLTDLPKAYKVLDTWTEAQRIAEKYWTAEGMVIFREDYRGYFGFETFYKGGEVVSSESLSPTKYSLLVKEKEEFWINPETGQKDTYEYLSYFTCQKIGSRWWITDRRRR